jgi:hypothetical protein
MFIYDEAILIGTGGEMSSAVRQALGVLAGAAVMVGFLVVEDLNLNAGSAKSDCAPVGPSSAAEAKQAPPLRLATVALPPPPPVPVVKAAPKPVARPNRVTAEVKVENRPMAIKPKEMPTARSVKTPTKFLPRTDQPAAPTAARTPLNAGKVQETEGRPLLRLLEHGEGPNVEIAWPNHPVARAKLYDAMRRCHGLRSALLRGEEILMSTPDGAVENFDADRFSGFIRAIQGPPTKVEARRIKVLRARHEAGGASAIRLLSRHFDARLLGGLRHLVGAGYRAAGSVTARYAIAGRRVMVHGIVVDGRETPGRIEIEPSSRCSAKGV